MADFGSAGVVRADDVAMGRLPCGPNPDEQFFCSPDPRQGGATSRVVIVGTATLRRADVVWDNHVFAGHRKARFRDNFTGLALDSRGDGLEQAYEAVTVGWRGRARFGASIFERRHALELGYVARHDVGTTRLARMRWSSGIPYRALIDADLSITRIGGHASAELNLTEAIGLRLGIRADAFGLSAREATFPSEDRSGPRLPADATDAWGLAIAPRGSVLVALAPWLSWQTSVGVGTRSSDATALSTGEQAPFAQALASETGLVARYRDVDVAIEGRVVAHHSFVERELVFDAERGRNVDAGASSRLGASAVVDVTVGSHLEVRSSFAWTEAFLLSGRDFGLVTEVRLPYVPRWVGRADIVGRHALVVEGERIDVGIGVGASWLGERPLPLGRSAEPVLLCDARIAAAWRGLELAASTTNLFDVRWRSAVFHYASHWDPARPASRAPEDHFSAGAPFAVDVTLGVRFDETRGLFAPSSETRAEMEDERP